MSGTVRPKQDLSLLFAPMMIGKMKLKNRIVGVATATGLAPDDEVTDSLKQLYAARARGGAGLIVTEGCAVDSFNPDFNLGIFDDKFIAGLRELVETVHRNGAAIGIQIIHYGRQWPPGASVTPSLVLVAPSAIPWSPSTQVPKELTIAEIEQIEQKFVEAARRAKKAGSDMVELQAAHGYLINQFFSPLSNQRRDNYGGDLRGRTRFAVEIIRRIKETLGPDLVLSCRLNGAENVPGGLALEEMKAIASLLAEAGLDMLSISAGVYGSYPSIIPPYDMPEGCYVDYAEGIKSVVSIPVVVAGRITDPHLAEEILRKEKADLIGLGRVLIADPEWPNKARRGELDEIRKCLGCNRCLDSVDINRFQCTVNPTVGNEKEFEILAASKPKEVMVVGGGLAGLEAARTAASRGHKVSLYEESGELGGQWKLAAVPPHKQSFRELVSCLSRQAEKAGVRIELGKKVTAAIIEEKRPDVVIIATGALPLIPAIPGAMQSGVLTAWDILNGHSHLGGTALVIGGNSLGLEVADFLSESGTKVTVVELERRIGRDMSSTVKWHLLHRLKGKGVKIVASTEVREIMREGIVVATEKGNEIWQGYDAIILALGSKSRNELTSEVQGKVREVYVIGDAFKPRQALDAILDGNLIGRKI